MVMVETGHDICLKDRPFHSGAEGARDWLVPTGQSRCNIGSGEGQNVCSGGGP